MLSNIAIIVCAVLYFTKIGYVIQAAVVPTGGSPIVLPRATPNTTDPFSNSCITPVGKDGTCIDIYQCKSLLRIIGKKPLLVENKLYLQRSECNRIDNKIHVCCPNSDSDNKSAPSAKKMSLIPQPPACGRMVTNRLYGGPTTEVDAYAWTVLLEYSKGENRTHHCGGALISSRYVLTAAHCITSTLKRVRLGEWDTTKSIDCSIFYDIQDCADSHIDANIEKVIPHEQFDRNSGNRLHDIALIRLAEPVQFSDFVNPVCLPTQEYAHHGFDGQSLDLVGWGATEKGLWVPVKEKTDSHVMPLASCRSKFAAYNIDLQDSQFCIENQQNENLCRSDSGGPAVSFDTGNRGLGSFFIVGTQSFVVSCRKTEWPVVYTRVSSYMDWILANIQP